MIGRTQLLPLRVGPWTTTAALCAGWLMLADSIAHAQQFVAPAVPSSPTIVGGPQALSGPQVLQVGPDGMVHLDGPPMAPGLGYATPQYGQPLVQNGVLAPGAVPQGVAANNQQYPWWRPFAKDWDALGQAVYEGPVAPHYAHRHGFWGEFIYLRPRDADVTFAVPTDGAVNPVPIGPTGTLNPDFEPGFRAGLNARLSDCASLAVQYTRLSSETTAASSISAILGELQPVLLHPGTLNTTSASQDANARLNLDMDLLDVQFRGMLDGLEQQGASCADATHYLLGVRMASLDQRLNANYIVTGTTSVATAVDFAGAGLSAGIESERYNNNWGVFIYGRGLVHVLAGEFDASYVQQNSFNGVEAQTSWTGARIVPVVETELGVGWTGPRRHLRFSAGYMISAWFNMVQPDEFIGATQMFDFSGMSDMLTFDGLTARVEWRF
ncbi:MAG: hypothetical protein KDA61_17660 [Planctomycetales bacterium]|nr:hypothetical protein [Planctomycetales bacterium]